jgi:hypothetical protein
MPIIFDVLYREFCRARLAEMRKDICDQRVRRVTMPLSEGRKGVRAGVNGVCFALDSGYSIPIDV